MLRRLVGFWGDILVKVIKSYMLVLFDFDGFRDFGLGKYGGYTSGFPDFWWNRVFFLHPPLFGTLSGESAYRYGI